MRTVILDAGHGCDTAGKRSPRWSDGTQLFEWKFNRDVVEGISNRLTLIGIPNVVLVPEDNDISLVERVRRANRIFSKDTSAYLVSIHANGFNGDAYGWEVFTSIGDTPADPLATIFFEKAQEYLPFKMRTDYSDGDPDKESRFFILHKTKCPAVLTENGFMDNEEDCRYMMSHQGKSSIIEMHVDAIKQINQQFNN